MHPGSPRCARAVYPSIRLGRAPCDPGASVPEFHKSSQRQDISLRVDPDRLVEQSLAIKVRSFRAATDYEAPGRDLFLQALLHQQSRLLLAEAPDQEPASCGDGVIEQMSHQVSAPPQWHVLEPGAHEVVALRWQPVDGVTRVDAFRPLGQAPACQVGQLW